MPSSVQVAYVYFLASKCSLWAQ